MRLTLPDGRPLTLADGATGADAAAAIGPGLAKAAVAVTVDGEVADLRAPLPDGAALGVVTDRDETTALSVLRHSTAHVLAEAVTTLWPGTRLAIGPPTDDGFFYDFDPPEGVTISEADLPRIEVEMRRIVAGRAPFTRDEVTTGDALAELAAAGEPYKVEIVETLPGDPGHVTFFTQNAFRDLCRGPHVRDTGRIAAFALTGVAGAYWRGRSDQKMLTRISGTAFFSKQDLAAWRERLEQARRRDHRVLGRRLDLWSFREEAPGMVFLHPRGMRMYRTLERWILDVMARRGYDEVRAPQILHADLWRRSGHYDNYAADMFFTEADGVESGVKPMNCPGHALLFSEGRRSYRDLPIRYAEVTTLHRDEPSGALHGLFRVRAFAQDDGHHFCTEEQLADEIARCVEMTGAVYDAFGLEWRVELSTRPDKRIGDDALWDHAEGALGAALATHDVAHTVNEGDGAFYGPKIDFHVTDAIGRSWQLGTVQLDYNTPERLDLSYVGADDERHRPVMIHRAVLGSIERFLAILTEDVAGDFPLWLSPEPARVLPVSDRFDGYATSVRDRLRAAGVRAEVDLRGESVGKKIREAELDKVPYMLVCGEREAAAGSVAVRRQGEGDRGASPLDEVVAELAAAVAPPVV